MHQVLSKPATTFSEPCEIFFHIPKTGGQTLHNLISREYRHRAILDTHCGLLTTEVWRKFTERLASSAADWPPRYDAVTGHMKLEMHELVKGPSRYITILREPVSRFVSYYSMLRRMGIVPKDHQVDPNRPDWNLSCHETLPRELDNGQTRALAGADWDLPVGECTEEHLKMAKENIDNHFAFVGLTEHFDLSFMMLRRICKWQWRFYAPKNITPAGISQRLSPKLLDAIARLNRFDLELHRHATEKLMKMAHDSGAGFKLEHAAYVTFNTVHRGKHIFHQALKRKLRRAKK